MDSLSLMLGELTKATMHLTNAAVFARIGGQQAVAEEWRYMAERLRAAEREYSASLAAIDKAESIELLNRK